MPVTTSRDRLHACAQLRTHALVRGLCLTLALGVSTQSATVDARKKREKKSRTTKKTTQTTPTVDTADITAAEHALAAKDPAKAIQILEGLYQTSPSPELLLLLALAAHGQGQTVWAQDLVRRGLADPTLAADSSLRARVALVQALPRVASGEVYVQGPAGSLLRADGHLLGVLPLPAPALLPAGIRSLELEEGKKPLRGQVPLRDGYLAEVRFSRESGAVLVTVPPAVILLANIEGGSDASHALVQKSVEQAARRAQLGVLNAGVALNAAPELRGCLTTAKCQRQLMQKTESDYVLMLDLTASQASGTKGSGTLRLRLLDAVVGDVAAEIKRTCTDCSQRTLIEQLPELLEPFLRTGSTRGHGTLELSSTPSGIPVYRAGELLGQTPLTRQVFGGTHPLELRPPGQKPYPVSVDVTDGGTGVLRVDLSKPVAPLAVAPPIAPTPVLQGRAPRPTWRLALGGVALGGGALLTGFGISALAVDGGCVSGAMGPCARVFETRNVGLGLTVSGAALIGTGLVLMIVPGPKQ